MGQSGYVDIRQQLGLISLVGLFNPGDLPKPTSEVFLKDMEPWEKPFEGIKHFDKNM